MNPKLPTENLRQYPFFDGLQPAIIVRVETGTEAATAVEIRH